MILRALPIRWLMTDERMGDALWPALRRLPPGAGIVFRHHATPAPRRARLWRRVRRIARARRLVLVVAGDPLPGADGIHGAARASTRGSGLRTRAAHDRAQALAGARAGADLLFVSPVFPTRSHPGAPALGIARTLRIARGLRPAIIALGGMTPARCPPLRPHLHGWAAIDAWSA